MGDFTIKRYNFDSHEEWLKERSKSIGASAIGTIFGVNKYETPASLADKMKHQLAGCEVEESESLAIRRGHAYEGGVAQMWSESVRKQIIGRSSGEYLCRRSDIPFMHASPDRIYWIDDNGLKAGKNSEANKGVLECKTTRQPIDPDNLPMSWQLQLQTQMGICGYKEGYIAYDVLTSADGFGFVKFDFNEEVFTGIVKMCEMFWSNYVIGDKVPEAASTEDILRLYPKSVVKSVPATDTVMESVRRLKDVKEAIKVLEADKDELELAIKNAIGDADTLTYGDEIVATWKSSKPSMRFDEKAFKEANADLWANFCKETAGSRRFILK